MRTIIYNFGGEPTDGDLLIINVCSARGGASSAKCVIGDPNTPDVYIKDTTIRRGFRKAQTLEDATNVFASFINTSNEFSPTHDNFRAVAKGTRLTIMASNDFDDCRFEFDVEGAKTETCEIEIIG